MTAHPTARAIFHGIYADRDDPTSRSRYLQLAVHATPDDMRAAATRYDHRRNTTPDSGYTDTLGVFHASPFRSRYDRSTNSWIDTTPAFAGIIRLTATHLGPEYRTHEATHAAIHLTRLHHWSKPGEDNTCDLGTTCDTTEEAFAYLLGGLADILDRTLHQLDLL